MAKFTSPYKSLTLQDDNKQKPFPWAQFVNGELETDDKAVIERLRKVSDGSVTEVEPEAPVPPPSS